jgi:hypothetical protein
VIDNELIQLLFLAISGLNRPSPTANIRFLRRDKLSAERQIACAFCSQGSASVRNSR